MVRSTLILFIPFFLLTFSCDRGKDSINDGINQDTLDKNRVYSYLFMSHIYDKNPIIDKRITKDRLAKFDQIWLGGDLTDDSSFDWKLKYLDSVLNVRSNSTHWAFGNHDIRSGREKVLDFVDKASCYAVYINGITLILYDSNYNDIGDCENVNRQTKFIKGVCDTISESSHLILLAHHIPWGRIEGLNVMSFGNTSIENRVFQCDTSGFFHNTIYPELIKVQDRNVQVISLAGDLGQKQSTFEYQTEEGIFFLGNGNLSTNEYNKIFEKYNESDSVLIFFHTPAERKLIWKFATVGND